MSVKQGTRYATAMHLVLPDVNESWRLIPGGSERLSEDAFFEFCMANRELNIERNAQGEIVIAPPVGGESDYRSADLAAQLGSWAKRDKRGRAFGSSVCFLLPDGSAMSPDAAWVDSTKLLALEKTTRKKFLPIVPDFVVEVMSPSDRLSDARLKMEQWIGNGTALGWLIDGDKRTVYVYRPGVACEKFCEIERLEAGEGPVRGFVVDLADVWVGL